MTGELKPRLHMPAHCAAAIREAAANAYPHECCGLLVGEGEGDVTVTAVIPARNVAEDPRKAFAIDPQEQFDALRATRGQRQRIVGHYHSHPDGQAAPSVHDLAMAHDPDAIWIVVGATPHEISAPRAFRRPQNGDSFLEMALKETP